MLKTFSFNKTKSFTAIIWIICLGFFSYLLFYKLGFHPFLDWDESLYAQVAKEALLNHNYLSFTSWGNSWLEKPPLPLWFTILGFKIFGVSEFGARFFVSLFALGNIISIYFLGKIIGRSKLAGVISVSTILICHHFFLNSFFLNFDTYVSFFICASVLSFKIAQTKEKYFYLFWSMLALGVLSKNVVGLLPLPILFLYSLAKWDFKFLKNKAFYFGFFIFLAIVAPWHIYMSLKFGQNFWDNYLLYHVFSRFSNSLENNGGPFWTYLDIFKLNYLLTPLTVLSFIYFFVKYFKDKSYALLPIACLLIFFFFSFAKTKGYGYIVPLYSFLACMLGITIFESLNFIKNNKFKFSTIFLVLVIFIGLGIQYQNFKIFRWGGEMYFYDNKYIAEWLKFYYPNAKIYTDQWFHAGPAVAFYFGKYINGLPKDTPKITTDELKKGLILHRPTRNIYKIQDYLFIGH
jgi:4-amino-4-deoxy-L-arabinose transferase